MNNDYELLEIEVIKFDTDDVIVTSCPNDEYGPVMP